MKNINNLSEEGKTQLTQICKDSLKEKKEIKEELSKSEEVKITTKVVGKKRCRDDTEEERTMKKPKIEEFLVGEIKESRDMVKELELEIDFEKRMVEETITHEEKQTLLKLQALHCQSLEKYKHYEQQVMELGKKWEIAKLMDPKDDLHVLPILVGRMSETATMLDKVSDIAEEKEKKLKEELTLIKDRKRTISEKNIEKLQGKIERMQKKIKRWNIMLLSYYQSSFI